MKIVADENIPYIREAFGALGDVVTLPGRRIDAESLRDASLLLVRSITKVNESLLDGTDVRFVATATIGEDHIDRAYLDARGIGFSSAPGCNANSVAEYIVAALLEAGEQFGFSLRAKRLGIVGVGNVGSRVHAKAAALGIDCVLNDPPLARLTGDARYRPIGEVYDCDIVTFHVPLTKEGLEATYHLVDDEFVRSLQPGALIINSSRGPVASGEALRRGVDSKRLTALVLDVWEGEPEVNVALLDRTFLATPHIAGYSFDGKVNGTRQIYEAACRFLQIEPAWDPSPLLPAPECAEVRLRGGCGDVEEALRGAVRQVYDIRRDDAAMRELPDLPVERRGAHFDRLRKEYPRRREFFNTRAVVEPVDPELTATLAGVGFVCEA